MTIELIRTCSGISARCGSVTETRTGFYWHGFAEGKGRSARSPSKTLQECLTKARKALGPVQAYDTETFEYL